MIFVYLTIAFALNYAYCCWKALPCKTFTKEQKTNILITGGLQGIGKLLAKRFAKNFNKDEI